MWNVGVGFFNGDLFFLELEGIYEENERALEGKAV